MSPLSRFVTACFETSASWASRYWDIPRASRRRRTTSPMRLGSNPFCRTVSVFGFGITNSSFPRFIISGIRRSNYEIRAAILGRYMLRRNVRCSKRSFILSNTENCISRSGVWSAKLNKLTSLSPKLRNPQNSETPRCCLSIIHYQTNSDPCVRVGSMLDKYYILFNIRSMEGVYTWG